ncbi:MAG: ABC transporter ATP-binding protein [Candidatus Scalindua rubra]|uniref:ATP-binding protein Wzt of ABC-transporter involved in LPS biosynthesis n=1 Tax=Candidatus Scalindua brodae TaxID=237368 RepID=A0A0B0EPC4_9BACT|nr:MAG: ATP-binding protein Wzt of ABC-transporter involved in LPS biosynthesis [Candidatus Scalindua brodae]MBZ0110418.1 ABC transporter ATP-binding protein [Candidatus Scalindua rubra]TWU36251.1 Teichoic acids export ATP-binding protein TagH [Candidatus Brocadiaceae bacterium S225]
MSDVVIDVENLSKQYRIVTARDKGRTFREALTDRISTPIQLVRNVFSADDSSLDTGPDSIWALKDVSFQVKQGEALGIIGRNGAGKTTLLKILSRITEPTEGKAIVRGRVGSLLEVGAGFHSELTGRENVYLSGSILGMKRAEIDRKFDKIVDFAEVEKFIDTPVKRYSTGMYMRLAFAVTANLDPEILFVDEVLAVGDAVFHTKCLAQMSSIIKQGRTVLFVSHNLSAVSSICRKGILLESGKISFSGSARETISFYNDQFAEASQRGIPLSQRKDRTGSEEVKLTNFYIENEAGERIEQIRNGHTIRLIFDFDTKPNQEVENVDFQVLVLLQSGEPLLQFGTRFTGQKFKRVPPKGKFVCEIRKFPLVPGHYRLDAYLVVKETPSDYIKWLTLLDVIDGDFYQSGYCVYEQESKFLVDGTWSCNQIS